MQIVTDISNQRRQLPRRGLSPEDLTLSVQNPTACPYACVNHLIVQEEQFYKLPRHRWCPHAPVPCNGIAGAKAMHRHQWEGYSRNFPLLSPNGGVPGTGLSFLLIKTEANNDLRRKEARTQGKEVTKPRVELDDHVVPAQVVAPSPPAALGASIKVCYWVKVCPLPRPDVFSSPHPSSCKDVIFKTGILLVPWRLPNHCGKQTVP